MQCRMYAMLKMQVVVAGNAQPGFACPAMFYQLETDEAACSCPVFS